MLHLLALVLIGALIWLTIFSIPLFLVGGFRWDDLRRLVLHYAYKSFTHEGDVIPGVQPSPGTRLVIRLFSPGDDARRVLVTTAIAIAEQWERPRSGSEMSRALDHARWFTAPPLGARFRAQDASRSAA